MIVLLNNPCVFFGYINKVNNKFCQNARADEISIRCDHNQLGFQVNVEPLFPSFNPRGDPMDGFGVQIDDGDHHA
jgi:hypothetical protein